MRIVGRPVGGQAGEDEGEGEGAEISGLVYKGTAGDAPASCSMRESCSTSNNVRALSRDVLLPSKSGLAARSLHHSAQFQ